MPCLRVFHNLHIGLIHNKIKLQSFNDYDHEFQVNLIYWTRSTFCYDTKLKSLNTFSACVKICLVNTWISFRYREERRRNLSANIRLRTNKSFFHIEKLVQRQ